MVILPHLFHLPAIHQGSDSEKRLTVLDHILRQQQRLRLKMSVSFSFCEIYLTPHIKQGYYFLIKTHLNLQHYASFSSAQTQPLSFSLSLSFCQLTDPVEDLDVFIMELAGLWSVDLKGFCLQTTQTHCLPCVSKSFVQVTQCAYTNMFLIFTSNWAVRSGWIFSFVGSF